jgi:D-alanine-D-alanine ligase
MRVGVLFGGDSEERDVSIASASQVVDALRSRGHEVVLVDTARGAISADAELAALSSSVPKAPPARDTLDTLRGARTEVTVADAVTGTDVVFLALHGGSGENGQFQALLELAGATFTGSGSLGSTLAMDKDIAKRLFAAAGIPTPRWAIIKGLDSGIAEIADSLGYPLIVKPNAQGSTVGLSLVRTPDELDAAVRRASIFGEVLLEEFIAGRELTVGVLDGKPLAVGEILLDPDTAFSYEQKYQAGAVREEFPAGVTDDLGHEAQRLALAAHECLKLDDYSRADFRLDGDGKLWLIGVNTLPGLTSTSLLPQSAAAMGIDYPTLCEMICDLAMRRGRGRP